MGLRSEDFEPIYIVEIPNRGYGRTDYVLVRACSLREALDMVSRKRFPDEKASIPSCEVFFNDDGISDVISHVW